MTGKPSFAEKVAEIPEIAACYKPGLQALGSYSQVIKVASTRDLRGSIFIDECSGIPNSKEFPKRWDYLFAYQEKILAVEVHPASGDNNVKDVIKKAEWLRNWLKNDGGKKLEVMHPYFFVATGSVNVKNGSIGAKLAQKGIHSCGKVLDVEKEMKVLKY